MKTRLSRLINDERVRFLIVGGINVVFGYGLFVLFELTMGIVIGYLGSLYASYVLGVIFAFVLHRRVTFRAHRTGGSVVLDFVRFASVYVVALVFNTVGLPLLVEVGHLPPIAAQAIIVVITPLITYVGHKYFSFARPSPGSSETTGDARAAQHPDAAGPAPRSPE